MSVMCLHLIRLGYLQFYFKFNVSFNWLCGCILILKSEHHFINKNLYLLTLMKTRLWEFNAFKYSHKIKITSDQK